MCGCGDPSLAHSFGWVTIPPYRQASFPCTIFVGTSRPYHHTHGLENCSPTHPKHSAVQMHACKRCIPVCGVLFCLGCFLTCTQCAPCFLLSSRLGFGRACNLAALAATRDSSCVYQLLPGWFRQQLAVLVRATPCRRGADAQSNILLRAVSGAKAVLAQLWCSASPSANSESLMLARGACGPVCGCLSCCALCAETGTGTAASTRKCVFSL